jgi:hypothetical protein
VSEFQVWVLCISCTEARLWLRAHFHGFSFEKKNVVPWHSKNQVDFNLFWERIRRLLIKER